MMMMILAGDPDRACRVACQDSKISYRFVNDLHVAILIMMMVLMIAMVARMIAVASVSASAYILTMFQNIQCGEFIWI